ncbi:hypothetical protein NNJEOMEG_00340 [Fundidesulfovibrio magnetotacticus]|uniref:Uncharacterized protein n=1 Tax=Fundidesulfovibrio magnetotacticus TaxID=2730080 RepID=A0A6V8LW70_9BACT|nr:hypothetical protein [Fundidesulfovibrio magnetotacticus]GFK92515.1 hypothetical protein NNJEOMEG_00340 [Fundidesulfovibrio magnetotacticus]
MHRILLHLARRAALPALLLALLAAGAAAQSDPDMTLVAAGASITAVVGEEDGEGLWLLASDGTNYAVWTPEEVTVESLAAFQAAFKNKEVTLNGDVYKDKFGNLNLFVKALPQP